jgi:3,4-dihydroxy 2-butanone 4-phosphate synthase/GTP cyclohydrolase II
MRREAAAISPVVEIIGAIRAGEIVILVDDEDRENEGDLVFAPSSSARKRSTSSRSTAAAWCACRSRRRTPVRLGLRPMVEHNRSRHGTNFTTSIEAAEGIATGISAYDRALTIKVAASESARPEDIVQPGHVFPLVAQPGGVLVRAGHTEACCDLARLAGLTPAAVLCEIMRDDGSMARLPDLIEFAAAHGLKIGTIADLIEYRSRNESLVQRLAERDISTPWGAFRLVSYRDLVLDSVHLALVLGTPGPQDETLVRVHEPLSISTFSMPARGRTPGAWARRSRPSERGRRRRRAAQLHPVERGARGAARGPRRDPRASRSVDLRVYGIGAQILRDLGVRRMRLMAAPRKMPSMAGFGLEVVGYVKGASGKG